MMIINDQRELELTECMLAAATAKMTASSLCYPHGESPSSSPSPLLTLLSTSPPYLSLYLPLSLSTSPLPLTFFSPIEVCRTRLRQSVSRRERRYHNFLQTLRVVWLEEGVRGLYGGMGAHLVRVVPNTAIVFFTYEAVLRIFERRNSYAQRQMSPIIFRTLVVTLSIPLPMYQSSLPSTCPHHILHLTTYSVQLYSVLCIPLLCCACDVVVALCHLPIWLCPILLLDCPVWQCFLSHSSGKHHGSFFKICVLPLLFVHVCDEL